jgi:sterol desaturase/sphingolipid hydroxylase (fatty acid hydroxylase superfamily)
MLLIMTVVTIILSLLISSFVEYCLHRFLLHSSYEQSHIKDHHRIFHGIKSYELKEVNADEILSDWKEMLLKISPMIPISILIFVNNMPLGILFILVSILYSLWSEYLHLSFHRSNTIFFARYEFFKKLKEHHRVHHYIYSTNYGIGTTFWDIVLKTKKK